MMDGSIGRLERIRRDRAASTVLTKRAPIRHIDFTLLFAALALTVFGNLMVFSASRARQVADDLPERFYLDRQVMFSFVGFCVLLVSMFFSYRRLKAWGPVVYLLGLGALVAVLSPLGSSVAGATRWINVGFFQLQPSEFMKIGVLIVLALLLSEARGEPAPAHVVRALLVVGIPGLFIFVQPDLGTMLVLMMILLGSLVVAGTKGRMLLLLAVIGIISIVGALQLDLLKDYQVARLTGFLDPSRDLDRTGYNLNQARIAVGSGQLTGKGLFAGTQTNLDFVPEVHTDFIFTAVGEELGFVGACGLLALYALFLWRGLRIAMLSKDMFGTLLAAGVVVMFAFQVFVNIGMTIGVSPITGIPLPFVSYGGSAMITTYVATGILLNVHMRRLV